MHWHLEPEYAIPLFCVGGLYVAGATRLWRRAGLGHGITPASATLFFAGWLALAANILTPLHEWAQQVFWLHMVEHEILMVIAAPLVVLARPAPAFLWAFNLGTRRRLQQFVLSRPVAATWRWLTSTGVATLLHSAAFWLWHARAAFEQAVAHEAVHVAQHLSFVLTALLFWSAVLPARPQQANTLQATVALFVMSVQGTLLGALIAVSRRLWYPDLPNPYPLIGLDRWEDQQMAGIIMWIPVGAIYLAAALWPLGRLLTAQLRGPRQS